MQPPMNNPLPGSHRPSVCLGLAFPMAILLWTFFFILPRSGEQWLLPSERAIPICPAGSKATEAHKLTACFPLIVPHAPLYGGTRTAGSTQFPGAARVFPPTSVTNCNHHERGRAGSDCPRGRQSCFGTPLSSHLRGTAPVLLSSRFLSSDRTHYPLPTRGLWIAGP